MATENPRMRNWFIQDGISESQSKYPQVTQEKTQGLIVLITTCCRGRGWLSPNLLRDVGVHLFYAMTINLGKTLSRLRRD